MYQKIYTEKSNVCIVYDLSCLYSRNAKRKIKAVFKKWYIFYATVFTEKWYAFYATHHLSVDLN